MSIKVCPKCFEAAAMHEQWCPECRFPIANVPRAYKRCPKPECSKRIEADKKLCLCGADMTAVPLTMTCPKCERQQLSENEDCANPTCDHSFKESAPARICHCGRENPVLEANCAFCSRTMSETDIVHIGEAKYILVSPDGQCCIPVGESAMTVGRAAAGVYYLSKNVCVSRYHLNLNITESGNLYVTDKSSNGTWLYESAEENCEGIKLPEYVELPVSDGCQLSLAGKKGSKHETLLSVIKIFG